MAAVGVVLVIHGIETVEAVWDRSHLVLDAVIGSQLLEPAFAEADLGQWMRLHGAAVEVMAHKSAFVEFVRG